MPIKNGIEASKEILEINKDANIIFASADKDARKQARMLGALSFKDKPFSNEKLMRNIEKALKNTLIRNAF